MPELRNNALDMLATLDLVATDPVGGTGETDFFLGQSQFKPDGIIFGGQVLSQCVVAAAKTVSEDRSIHSFHGYFLRPGNALEPIVFGVERLRDGRSFSARRIHAYQNEKPIMSAMASFQVDDDGFDHQDRIPSDVPDPESLGDISELLGGHDVPHINEWLLRRPFHYRPVAESLYLKPPRIRGSKQSVWVKAMGDIPDDRDLHAAFLAYASDFNMLEPTMRAHGVAWRTKGLRLASLDHAMWWHRRARADEWMLFVQDSPSAENGRGLGLLRIFARTGELLATVGQQGIVRLPRES